jgi:hypothetical protein
MKELREKKGTAESRGQLQFKKRMWDVFYVVTQKPSSNGWMALPIGVAQPE